MPATGNQAATSFDEQELLSRKARHPFCLAPPLFPHISAKPYLCLAALMLFCLISVAPAIAADTTYWIPWVTDLTTGSATINWLGVDDASSKYSVEYATKKHYEDHNTFQSKIESPAQGTFQHVLIAGLEPDTSYVYKVTVPVPAENPNVFPIGNFKTMPVSGPFTFLVISDSHAQEGRFQYVAEAIAKYETDALFILDGGDYAGADDKTYWTDYFNYNVLIDENTVTMFSKFPIFHTVGNHEYHQHPLAAPPTQAVLYHNTFDIAEGKPLNYSFDCSGIRFIVLNSPDPSMATDTDTDPQTSLPLAQSQALWLKGQLDNNMAGTFIIHHHPKWYCHEKEQKKDEPVSYEIRNNSNLQPWVKLYSKYGISANFTGHVHNYQRFSIKGVPYFIVGNGGGLFNTLGTPIHPDVSGASYQFGETFKLGYLKVMVDPAKNTATAQEIFVASVSGENQDNITKIDPPLIADQVNFPLSSKLSTLTVTMNEDKGIVASYPPYEIYCDSKLSPSKTFFRKKEKVVLMAIPDAGYTVKWNGDCKSSGQQCYVTMSPNKDITVEAVFDKDTSASIQSSTNTIPLK